MKILPTNMSSFVSRMYDSQVKIFFLVAFFLHAHVQMKKQFLFLFFFLKLAFNLLLITYWSIMFLKSNYSSDSFKNLFPSDMPFDLLYYL